MKISNSTKVFASLLLKLMIFVCLSTAAAELVVYTLAHRMTATYTEPLNPEQTRLKNIFLSEASTPGRLSEAEKNAIAEAANVDIEIFGITIKEITIHKLNLFLVISSGIALTLYALGFNTAVAARHKRQYWKLLSTLHIVGTGILLLMLWLFYGSPITQVAALLFFISHALGLLNWPLWTMVDKIFGKNVMVPMHF
jgi:hypothetical protein